MASQSRKYRGYKTQDVVAQYFSEHGFPYALSTGAGRTGSDITGVPFDVEVKATTRFEPKANLDQLRARRSSSGELGFCVLRFNGQGEGSVGQYGVLFDLESLVGVLSFLDEHGYFKKN